MSEDRIAELSRRIATEAFTRRRLLKGAAAGLAVPAMGAGLGRAAGAAPRPGGETTARYQADATTLVIADNMSSGGLWLTLDPGQFYEINPSPLMNVVYETLYHLPDSSQPDAFEPLLAESMPEVSADGTEVTVRLRSGVSFHNTGNPMTADDWVFSLNRTRNLQGNPAYLTEYWTSVEAVDPSTLLFTLEAPNPALVAILTSPSLSVSDSVAVAELGGTAEPPPEGTPATGTDAAGDAFQETSFGTGPYILTQYDPNTEVIIERNPDYWGEAPALERIVWRNIVGANEQLQAVQAGEADIAFALDPDAIAQVEEDENLQLLSGQSISLQYLGLHTQEEPGGPLATKEVRQAIAHAIDYDGIINDLLAGAAVRPATVVPLPFPGTETVQAEAYTTDLARAQELFDAAGLGDVEITLSFRAEGQGPSGLSEPTLATKLQSDLEQIDGLTVNLEPMDANTWIADYRASSLQFVLAPWGPDFPGIETYTEPFGRSGQGVAQRVGYENPEVDATLDQIITETDPAAKEELYVAVQRALIGDVPFILLYQPTISRPARTTVQGVTIHFVYQIQLRYASKTE